VTRTLCARNIRAMVPSASMSYAEKNLAPGETIVLRASYHWTIYRAAVLLLVLAVLLATGSLYASQATSGSGVARPVGFLGLFFLVLAALAFAPAWLQARAAEFVVTNRRVIRKVGIVAREIEQAPLEKIQDITVDQGFIGRLLDFGTVTIETASERGSMTFPRIAHPEAFRNALWGQAPSPSLANRAPSPPAPAVTRERLAELERLRQQGLVSDDEYAAKRREILAGL
jgi:membrane protein YdbS with pleckstrin-like domain